MKKVSHILMGLCLVSSSLARNVQQPFYLGYQDSIGQYSFGYSAPGSARSEVRESDGRTRGSYSYVDDNGLIQSAEYTADAENGFRISATNLPQHVEDTPEVKAARAAHLEALRLAYEREEQEKGEFGLGSGQPAAGQVPGQEFEQPGSGQEVGQPGSGQGSGQGFGQPDSGQESEQTDSEQGFGQPESGQESGQGFGQTGFVQPGFGQPEFGQPGFGQPVFGQPGFVQPVFGHPGFGQPGFVQLGIGQTSLGKPGIGQPVFSQPGFGQLGIGQPVFGQPGSGEPGIQQPGIGQQEQDPFGGSVVVEANIGKTETEKQNQNVNGALSKNIIGHVHTNIVSEVPEALQSSEVDAARRAYITAISEARAKADSAKINYMVKDVITRLSSNLGPFIEATVTDESGDVGQHLAQSKNFQHKGQVSSPLGSLLRTQGLSQSSGIAPSSTTLIMKNETHPSAAFMKQIPLKDKESPPIAGTQLYRIAVPSHLSKLLVVPSTYAPIKYGSDTGTPLQQPSFAVQCFITRADQLENLVDVRVN